MDEQNDFELSMAQFLGLEYEELQRIEREAAVHHWWVENQERLTGLLTKQLIKTWATQEIGPVNEGGPLIQELQSSVERLEKEPEIPNWVDSSYYGITERDDWRTGDEGVKDCSPLRSGGDEPRVKD